MDNKRGIWFSLYLPILTVLMCGIVIGAYWVQADLDSSLVSPVSILELRDKMEIFEMQEKVLILEAVKNTVGEWKVKKESAMKDRFCYYFIQDENKKMWDFIEEDLYYKDKSDWEGIFKTLEARDNFCSENYGFEWDEGVLVVKRKSLGKRISLFAEDRSKINFAVDVEWKFGREYKIKEGD